MIESEMELMATEPAEQIARWFEQVERARIKRSRYKDQEAEGLMTREELRVKLAELDENVSLAQAEIEKLRCHEERLRAIEKSGEELLERLLPARSRGDRASLPSGEAPHLPAAPS